MNNDYTELQGERTEAMFVQSARAVTSSYRSLTLHGLSPSTLFIGDGLEQVVGHVHTKDFVELWNKGVYSFSGSPPNAVISFLKNGDAIPEDVIVVLSHPQLNGDAISYTVDVLEGTLPVRAGPCSLFIDPINSPLLIAGVCWRGLRSAEG